MIHIQRKIRRRRDQLLGQPHSLDELPERIAQPRSLRAQLQNEITVKLGSHYPARNTRRLPDSDVDTQMAKLVGENQAGNSAPNNANHLNSYAREGC
jgi:hypothetical protein